VVRYVYVIEGANVESEDAVIEKLRPFARIIGQARLMSGLRLVDGTRPSIKYMLETYVMEHHPHSPNPEGVVEALLMKAALDMLDALPEPK